MRNTTRSFPFRRSRSVARPAAADPAENFRLALHLVHNQRVVLQEIRVRTRITRGELAEITGLPKPTIVNVSGTLLDLGLIVETERVKGHRGQPAYLLELNPEGAYSVGLNIDRDHLTMVAVDLAGRARARSSFEIESALPDDVQVIFQQNYLPLLARASIPTNRIIGLGIALPDDLGGLMFPHKPHSYAVWNHTDVRRLFEQVFPGPVLMENDAVAAAIGESLFGHGLAAPSFMYLLVSVLLGGGLVINRNYYRGARGRSGEIGYLPIDAPDRPGCTVQDVVSLSALLERLPAGTTVRSPDDLLSVGPSGEATIQEWLDEASTCLTKPLLEVCSFIHLDAIFFGGRLPIPLLDRLTDLCTRKMACAAGGSLSLPVVRRAILAADAPAIGGSFLPFQAYLFPSFDSLLRNLSATIPKPASL